MSSPYQGYRAIRPQRPTRLQRPQRPSRFQETSVYDPYMGQAEENILQQKKRIGPLQLVLDLLSRGQYMSANVAQAITDAVQENRGFGEGTGKDILSGLWQGFLGREKGTYKDVIKDIAGEDSRLSKPIREGKKFLGKTAPGDIIGFALDILLDPTTYLSFGATKGAQVAAKSFADDIVKIGARQIGKGIGKEVGEEVAEGAIKSGIKGLLNISDDTLLRFARKGFDPGKFKDLMKKAPKKATEYLSKHGVDIGRMQNILYRQAQRAGLREPGEVLQKEVLSRLGVTAEDIAREGVENVAERLKLSPNIIEHALQGYGGGGERAIKFMGHEFAKGVRKSPIAKGAETQSWQTVRSFFERSRFGNKLSDAWWSMTNRGLIGELRKKFGFRNPYQKALRVIDLDGTMQLPEQIMQDVGLAYKSIVADITDEGKDQIRRLFEEAEVMWKPTGEQISIYELIDNPEYLARLGVKDPKSFRRTVSRIDEMLKKLHAEEKMWVNLGYAEGGEIINYMPTYWRTTPKTGKGTVMGGVKAKWMQQRNFTRAQTAQQEYAKLRWVFGLDAKDAKELVDKMGASAWSMDLDEVILGRLQGHAKMRGKVSMLQQFREFGIPTDEIGKMAQNTVDEIAEVTGRSIDEIGSLLGSHTKFHDLPDDLQVLFRKDPDLFMAVSRPGAHFDQLGLQKIDHPALDGLLFDNDVAEVLTRAIDITEKNASEFNKLFTNYMNWWRGIVTMTPGFHSRNFISNNITGFLNYGIKWFNVIKYEADSLVATVYALNKRNPSRLLSEWKGWSEGKIRQILNKRHGPYTVEELSNYMLRDGVISEAVMGFDPADTLQRMMGTEPKSWNPLKMNVLAGSRDNPATFRGMGVSHKVGDIIENQARAKAFLIDMDDIYGKGAKAKDGLMRNYYDDLLREEHSPILTMLTDQAKEDQAALQFAAQRAKKIFLDYKDLTPFEQNTMKKIIPFYCVPDYAEALTRSGWKRYDEIVIGEEILTYNTKLGVQEWKPIQKLHKFNFHGRLDVIKNKHWRFASTSEHKWPVQVSRTKVKGRAYGGEEKLVETKALNTSHRLRLASTTEDQESILSPRDAAILGWLVTDGYFRWRGNHFESMIYQGKEEAKNIIRELCGFHISSESVHPDTGVTCFRLKTAWALKVLKHFKNKDDLPRIATQLSTDAAKAMWESMVLAEGNIGKRGTTKEFMAFSQCPGPVLDAFQILSQILGKPYSFTVKKLKSKYGSNLIGRGYVRKTTQIGFKDMAKEKEPYIGVVWCPEVENHTWVMRQYGQVILTGNSWLRKNIANQIQGVVLNPGMYSMIPKLEDLMEQEYEGYDRSLIPDYMRQLGYFPMGKTDKGLFTMFFPDIPLRDIERLPFMFEETDAGGYRPVMDWGELKDDLISATNPLIKTVIEMIPEKGYDVWRKRDLDRKAEAPYALSYFVENPEPLGWLDSVIKFMGGKGVEPEMNEDGKVVMNAKVLKVIENHIPLIRQLDVMFEGGTAVPHLWRAMQHAIDEGSGEAFDEEKLESFFKILSQSLGIKFKVADLEEAKKYLRDDIYKEAQRLREDDTRYRPDVVARRDVRRAKDDIRIQRMLR